MEVLLFTQIIVMHKKLVYLTILYVLSLCCSCSRIDGVGDVPNFPTQTVSFPSDGGERILHSTNGINWSFGRVGIYAADAEFPTIKYYFETDENDGGYFNDINGGKRNFVSTPDFEAEKVDNATLRIKMNSANEQYKAVLEIWGKNGGDAALTIPIERQSGE